MNEKYGMICSTGHINGSYIFDTFREMREFCIYINSVYGNEEFQPILLNQLPNKTLLSYFGHIQNHSFWRNLL